MAPPGGTEAARLRANMPPAPAIKKYFLPYQVAWVNDQSPLKIVEKSRQIGFSYCDSYDSVKKVSVKGARLDVWVGSRDLTTAKQYLNYCKGWAKVLQIAAEDLGEQVIEKDKDLTAFVLKFASGCCIYSLSSSPDAFVGKTGHVKLDEYAVHRDQRELYRIVKPCTTWGGQLSLISTHRGRASVFNEIITSIREKGNPMGWSLHHVSLQDAVEQGLVEKIVEKTGQHFAQSESSDVAQTAESAVSQVAKPVAKPAEPTIEADRAAFVKKIHDECLDEEQWSQEYCCIPADDSTAFLPYDLITGCEAPAVLRSFEYLDQCPNDLYLGLDVARKKDLCVLDVGEKIGDVVWDRLRLELLNKRFAEIEDHLYQLLALPQLKRACIDATGLGMQLAERARERFGYKVEPVTFTGPVKEALAFPLKAAFEDKKLRVDSDPRLRADLRGIQKETTAAGNIRFVGDTDDSHCDRFWAKALRQHAAETKVQMGAATA
jgi:phage FluMu gp28-like protein